MDMHTHTHPPTHTHTHTHYDDDDDDAISLPLLRQGSRLKVNTRWVYPKVSGLATWSKNCKLYQYFVSQSS